MPRGISPPPTKRVKLSQPSYSPDVLPPPSLPPPPPCPNTLRIISWNINGITPFLQNSIKKYFSQSKHQQRDADASQSDEPANLRAFLQRHHWPAILFFQEVKIAATDTKTQNAVRNAVNTPFPSERSTSTITTRSPTYNVYFTLSTDRHNARGLGGTGKVYGVCTIIRSDLSQVLPIEPPEVRTVDWDKEGRVSIVLLTPSAIPTSSHPKSTLRQSTQSPTSLQAHSSPLPLAILNIYAVNGTTSPYRNPVTGSITGTRHTRKLAFHTLLMQECLSLQSQGFHVLLAGDFNIAPARIDGYPNLRCWPEQHVLNRRDFWEKFLEGNGSREGKVNRSGGQVREEEKEREDGSGEEDDEQKEDGDEGAQHFHAIDIWRATHPTTRRYTYFPRSRDWGTSCDRVDYVLASKTLGDTGRIAACGIMDSPQERGPSDHVPVWVDVDMTIDARPIDLEKEM